MNTIVVVGDLHINSSVALCPDSITLDDGDSRQPSKIQRWVNGCWKEFIEQVDKKKKGKLTTVFNGDTCDIDMKNRTYQIINRNKAVIKRMAVEVVTPLIDISDNVFGIRGTEAHVGNSGEIEELIFEDFDNTIKDGKNYTHWDLLLQVDDVKIDIAHHTRMGGLPHTQRKYADTLASEIIMSYGERKELPPDLSIRGHVHRFADSYDNFDSTRAIILGCWTVQNAFVYRIKSTYQPPELGGCLIYIDGDKYEVEKIKYKPARRTWIKLP